MPFPPRQTSKKTFAQWIAGALDDPDKDGKLVLMSLMHLRGGTPVEIHSMKFVDGENYNPETVANVFMGKAETDAQNLVGMQEYVLYPFYGATNSPQGRYPLLIDGGGGEKFNGMSTEGPDSRGQTQQAMRLTETIVKGTFGVLSSVQHSQHQHSEELARENRELRQENRDMLGFFKEILLEQTKLTHEQKLKEMEMAGNLEIKKGLMQALPVLTNQLTGKEIFPQSSEDTALIEMIASNIDPEQLAVVLKMSSINPAGQGALMNRLTRALKVKRAEAEKITALVQRGVGNAEAELADPDAAVVHEGTEEEKDAAQ